MTRTVSKFGIAAALTLGMLSTAAAQTKPKPKPKSTTTTTTTTKKTTTTPSMSIPVTKEEKGEVMMMHDTVTVTRYMHDTVTMYRRDTLTLTGPTVTRWDTVQVMSMPGWMDRGHGVYFGLGAGPTWPTAGLGGGQIPGYTFQANLGIDPAGSPLGIRLTSALARPDEAQPDALLGGRPAVLNTTADVKLRLPMFRGTTFPMFSLYGVAGGLMSFYKDLRLEIDPGKKVQLDGGNTNHEWHHAFGYNAGGGISLQIGHQRELFVEGRFLNFSKSGYESNHQIPIVLGLNWY